MEETTTEKMKSVLKRYWKEIGAVLLILALVIMVILVISSQKRQKEIEGQLERQNELVDALREKEGSKDTKEKVVITSDIIKERLSSIRELVTQEYIYTNADKREGKETWIFGWTRPFSENSIILTYDGTIKAGVDLNEVEVVVNEEKRTITVTLPPSKITDNNIPQETINVVEVKDGLFNNVTFDNYNEFISEQKLIMQEKAIDQGLLIKANEEAKEAIIAFLSVMPGIGDGEDSYKLEIK